MKHARVDIEFGIHSNIPRCCVVEYVLDSFDGIKSIAVNRWNELGYSWHYYFSNGIQYVPCRKCLKEIMEGRMQPNKLHICHAGCSRFSAELEVIVKGYEFQI